MFDTGAGSSFIHQDMLPTQSWRNIRPLEVKARIQNDGNRTINTTGTIDLTVELGNQIEIGTFKVFERLAVGPILRCNFCDKHVEAIRPQKSVVELDHGITVPIVRKPSGLLCNVVPLQAAKQYIPKHGCTSKKITVQKLVIIKPESRTFVTFTCEQESLIIVEPSKKLFDSHMCLTCTGGNQVTHGQPFKLLAANFERTHNDFCQTKWSLLRRNIRLYWLSPTAPIKNFFAFLTKNKPIVGAS